MVIVTPQKFTLMDALSKFAGLERALSMVFSLACAMLIKHNFKRTVLNEMYLVKRDAKDPSNAQDESEEQLTTEQRKNSFYELINEDQKGKLEQGKTSKFFNSTEKKNYNEMIKNIKENGNVRPSDIMSIVDNFWRNRTRFSAKISFL